MPTTVACFAALAATAVGWQIDATAAPADDLQAAFEWLPPAGVDGWLGADSDVSVVVKPGKAGVKRQLWIFADTFVGEYNPKTAARIWPSRMPRNTVGIAPCSEDGVCTRKPEFFWRLNASTSSGLARAFFDVDHPVDILWPVAALASRDGSEVLIMAQRIRGGLNIVGTTAISLTVGSSDDPCTWHYVTHRASGEDLTWFSGLSYEKPEDHGDDSVVLFGHANNTKEATMLARSRLSTLFAGNWSSLEYWSVGDAWASTTAALQSIQLPSWETTPVWSIALGRFYTMDLLYDDAGAVIDLWAAETITGPWQRTKNIYRVPAPFSGMAAPGASKQWLCYAAKAHPEMLPSTWQRIPAGAELAISYVCNALANQESTIKDMLYQRGGMALPLRGYWPKFLRISAQLSADISV